MAPPVHRESVNTLRHQPRPVARATSQVRATRAHKSKERDYENRLRAQRMAAEAAEKCRVQLERDRFEDHERPLVSGNMGKRAEYRSRKRFKLVGMGKAPGKD